MKNIMFTLGVTALTAVIVAGCVTIHEDAGLKKVRQEKMCPDWSSNPVSNNDNEDFSNFGCAYNNNLYVQIKDPEDFNHGNGKTEISATREGAIVQNYLSGAAAASSSASSSATSATSSR